MIFCIYFQLTVGLYEFKVVVDGENARGEGYVNVTVNPSELVELYVSLTSSVSDTCITVFCLFDWTLV